MHTGTRMLETERLVLRRFRVRDAADMFRNWACDAEVTRYLRWRPHTCVAESRALLRVWRKNYRGGDYYHWAIVRKSDGALVGSIGIMRSIEEHGPNGFEPGYCIGRAFWGRGYTTEALRACLGYFIASTGISTLYCCHAQGNRASGRVMQKAGFVFDHDGVYTRFDGEVLPAKFYVLRAGAAR